MLPRLSTARRTLFGVLILFTLLQASHLTAQTVVPIDKDRLRTLLAERHGRPLCLNIWATWCTPCLEEFPDIIRLSREHPEIDVVAISADYPDETESKIIPFLKTMNVPFKVYVASFDTQDEFFSMFDKAWGGELPATFIYTGNATLKKFLRGKHSFADFKKAVEEVAKKQ